MTKKSGLFDVDFSLTTQELAAAIKGEKVRSYSKGFAEALGTILKQMEEDQNAKGLQYSINEFH